MIRFFVPGAPFAKGRPRFARGVAYTDAQTMAAEKAVAWYAARERGAAEPLVGPVLLVVEAVFARPATWTRERRAAADWHLSAPDGDNIVKLVSDACNKPTKAHPWRAQLWGDDSQVQMIGWKRYARADELEGTHVTVAPVTMSTAGFGAMVEALFL